MRIQLPLLFCVFAIYITASNAAPVPDDVDTSCRLVSCRLVECADDHIRVTLRTATGLADDCCDEVACVDSTSCVVDGVVYMEGEFTNECNSCYCAHGRIVCTDTTCTEPIACPAGRVFNPSPSTSCDATCEHAEVDCIDIAPSPRCVCMEGMLALSEGGECVPSDRCPLPPPSVCFYDGNTYEEGQVFKDDCNTCTCSDGLVACTRIICEPVCENGRVWKEEASPCDAICNIRDVPCIDIVVARCVCPEGTVALEEDGECVTPDQCPTDAKCHYRGEWYSSGDLITTSDCSVCTCRNGEVSCDPDMLIPDCRPLEGCLSPTSPCNDDEVCHEEEVECVSAPCPRVGVCKKIDNSCVYGGVRYDSGESFKDDCNTCTCSDGVVTCTKMKCEPVCENGRVWKEEASPCDTICNIRDVPCIDIVVARCVCPEGTVALEEDGECVTPDQCPTDAKCHYRGEWYSSGDLITTSDCSVCTCRNGEVSCDPTTLAPDCRPLEGCLSPTSPCNDDEVCHEEEVECVRAPCPRVGVCQKIDKSCVVGEVRYESGESFKDDCNTCTCSDGVVTCTMMKCEPVCENGRVWKEEASPCDATCSNRDVICMAVVVARCVCPEGTIALEEDGECITPDQCPTDAKCHYLGQWYNSGDLITKSDCSICTCRNGEVSCDADMLEPDCTPNCATRDYVCPGNSVCRLIPLQCAATATDCKVSGQCFYPKEDTNKLCESRDCSVIEVTLSSDSTNSWEYCSAIQKFYLSDLSLTCVSRASNKLEIAVEGSGAEFFARKFIEDASADVFSGDQDSPLAAIVGASMQTGSESEEGSNSEPNTNSSSSSSSVALAAGLTSFFVISACLVVFVVLRRKNQRTQQNPPDENIYSSIDLPILHSKPNEFASDC